jgi:hypothetical protein
LDTREAANPDEEVSATEAVMPFSTAETETGAKTETATTNATLMPVLLRELGTTLLIATKDDDKPTALPTVSLNARRIFVSWKAETLIPANPTVAPT